MTVTEVFIYMINMSFLTVSEHLICVSSSGKVFTAQRRVPVSSFSKNHMTLWRHGMPFLGKCFSVTIKYKPYTMAFYDAQAIAEVSTRRLSSLETLVILYSNVMRRIENSPDIGMEQSTSPATLQSSRGNPHHCKLWWSVLSVLLKCQSCGEGCYLQLSLLFNLLIQNLSPL